MASYKVIFSTSVKQDVRGVARTQLGRIMSEIRSLADNPFSSGCMKLKGSKSGFPCSSG
jgi:mRNA-degrading endonuclease RelE of RelBE toxin-antitoxin system